MGNYCSCNDKDDTEQEVRVDPVSVQANWVFQKKLGAE